MTERADRGMRIAVAALLGAFALAAWALTVRSAAGMSGAVSGLGDVGFGMPSPLGAALFITMWLTMMTAMMFPAVAPMVIAHRMVVRRRGEGWAATLAFIGGYLCVWTAIGIVPFGALTVLQANVAGGAAPAWTAPLAGAVFLGAGLYQFSPLKWTCLRACRSPISFILSHDFRTGAAGAVRAGIAHGAYCLGCCWALMAILVAVGLMNVGWMAGLSVVFFLEKNWRYGNGVARFVGISLLMIGAAILVAPPMLGQLSGAHLPASGPPMRM